jgi:NADP-dependent 3-hydroxy acid dehydrogenase YdfG
MSNNIAGKIVVITSASSGLREATAWLLSVQGAKCRARITITERRFRRLGGFFS